jgi:hypothetical protein
LNGEAANLLARLSELGLCGGTDERYSHVAFVKCGREDLANRNNEIFQGRIPHIVWVGYGRGAIVPSLDCSPVRDFLHKIFFHAETKRLDGLRFELINLRYALKLKERS